MPKSSVQRLVHLFKNALYNLEKLLQNFTQVQLFYLFRHIAMGLNQVLFSGIFG